MKKPPKKKRTPKKELISASLRSLEPISEKSLFVRLKSYSWIQTSIFQFQKVKKSQMSLGKSFLFRYSIFLFNVTHLLSVITLSLPVFSHWSVQNGRVELDQSDNKECAVIVKNASSSDDGTWHFKVGYGANLDMKYYEHKAIVKVKGTHIHYMSNTNFQGY